MYETILHMHVVTSRGSKERNTIYRVKNFDDIGKVFTAERLDDFKYKIIKAYIRYSNVLFLYLGILKIPIYEPILKILDLIPTR